MSSEFAAAAAKSTPFIDWAALVKVAGASLVFGVSIVVLFSVGIVGLSAAQGAAAGGTSAAPRGRRAAAAALAGVCFLVCAAAVLYGLWIIIPQFHR